MIVVSDTSPINYLIQIEQIDLIPRLYGMAYIPPAVHAELLHPKAPPSVAAWAAKLPEWIVVRQVEGSPSHVEGLHRGEQEAISLAEALHARILLTDDLKARTAAHARGIATVTTLLILDAARRQGLG